ncbi:hypothetical protein BGX34_012135 [Mortierella sp. NVP85]|nr:hypothetical protein BGX34_012135 [Mortierella sp. NVP85]
MLLCFGISEQEIEKALSNTKTAFCTSTTVADKPANLEQCVKALKLAVDTLARIKKDGKRALNKDENIDLKKEIVDTYKELVRLQGYSGPDKAQMCFEFAGKWRGVVGTPEQKQPPQPQPLVHDSRKSVDSASISSGGTHSIPDQFYQADMASGSGEIDIYDEENSTGDTPGPRKVDLDIFLMEGLNDKPSDESLSRLTNPGAQFEKHTGCFADAAPRMAHSIKEIEINQSEQSGGDEPVKVKEHQPVGQPASGKPVREPAKYRVGRVLGKGISSTVKVAKHVDTGEWFAAKIVSKEFLRGDKGRIPKLKEDIAMMSKIHHPNCMSYVDTFETDINVYLIMQLAEGGELFDQLLEKREYPEVDAARLVREILLGVEYLHSVGIVHGDLCLENVLLLDTSKNSRLMIKGYKGDRDLTHEEHEALVFSGSNVAPEVVQQNRYGKPGDMWRIGVMAYMLLCGYGPFSSDDRATRIDSILTGAYEYEEEYWKGISQQAKSFIDSLLVPQAEKRPTATQALAHPWFRATLD